MYLQDQSNHKTVKINFLFLTSCRNSSPPDMAFSWSSVISSEISIPAILVTTSRNSSRSKLPNKERTISPFTMCTDEPWDFMNVCQILTENKEFISNVLKGEFTWENLQTPIQHKTMQWLAIPFPWLQLICYILHQPSQVYLVFSTYTTSKVCQTCK